MVAALQPQPDVVSTVRKLPAPRAAAACAETREPTFPSIPDTPAAIDRPAPVFACAASPRRTPVVMPLAPERFKIQFTVSREVHDKLRRAQDLLRHTIPDGDPAAIFDKALTLLLDRIAAQKWAATAHPRQGRSRRNSRRSRNIPAVVRRAVWARDQGQCAFIGTAGRCAERSGLEFHHVTPFAAGGEASVTNIEVRCRRHNTYESELWFGRDSAEVSEEVEGERAD
jgi:5-methylcytosine-specific restriction endonuclease McrA